MALLPNNERETDLGPYTQLDLRVLGPFYEVMSVPSGFCRGSLPRPFILVPTLRFAGQQQIQMTSNPTHPFQPFLPSAVRWFTFGSERLETHRYNYPCYQWV